MTAMSGSSPRWLVLRPYDLKSGSQVFIKADSAIRRPLKEEWELIGHVLVQGPDGQRLKTKRLFWLRAEKRLYSDDTTYFLTQGKELRGSHFNAKDDLSWYEIYDNKGAFDYDENKATSPTAPAAPRADTLKQAPPSLSSSAQCALTIDDDLPLYIPLPNCFGLLLWYGDRLPLFG